MANSQARHVRNYVQALEQEDRYIVMLYYADGLTPMEISRVLDLPSSKVRNRLEELCNQLASLAHAKPRQQAQRTAPRSMAAKAYA